MALLGGTAAVEEHSGLLSVGDEVFPTVLRISCALA